MIKRFETFTVLINQISRNIRKIKIKEMAEYNLRGAHISCLYHLYATEGLTATELCELCAEDKATISRALNYLEENGYLICESTNTKRYKSAFILTQKGSEVGEKLAQKVDRVLDEVSVGLTDEERVAFYHSLTVISKNLESILKKSEERG